MSPHTVTGQRTGWTFDSSINTSRAYISFALIKPTLSHNFLTSASLKGLHCMSCAIHASTSSFEDIIAIKVYVDNDKESCVRIGTFDNSVIAENIT